jgi:hypothetical protein
LSSDDLTHRATYTRASNDKTSVTCSATSKKKGSVTASDTFSGIDVSPSAPQQQAQSTINRTSGATDETNNSAVNIDDEVQVNVPPFGVTSGDTNVRVSAAVNDTSPEPLEGAVTDYNNVQVSSVSGTDASINEDVGVKMKLYWDTQADFDPSNLTVRYLDPADSQWKTKGISETTVNEFEGYISFRTDHLTTFAAKESSGDGGDGGGSGSGSDGGGGGGCVIERSGAPSWMEADLRQLRDWMMSSELGRWMTRTYYASQ